jgi:flagellar biogenesis protein FliO
MPLGSRFVLGWFLVAAAAPLYGQEPDARPSTPKAARSVASATSQPIKLTRKAPAKPSQNPFADLASPSSAATRTVVSGLAIVLGAFLLLMWVSKKTKPKGSAALPSEVVEVLGRAPLNAKQQMQLVRLGNRLLLLAMSPDSAETLAEISDPQEVERLTAICRQNAPGSVTETFRQVLDELSRQPARGGFVDAPPARARMRVSV